jgi:branched-subunit amino acid transport protein
VATVSDAWTAVVIVGVGTVVLKAAGPVLLGGRPLPTRIEGLLAVLAPALLAALVVTQAFASGRHLVFDARLAGLGAAIVAVLLRAPLLAVIVVAAAATALARALY